MTVKTVLLALSKIKLERLQFSCQISGTPEVSTELALKYFTELELKEFLIMHLGFYMGDCGNGRLERCQFTCAENEDPDWDSRNCFFGTRTSGIDKFRRKHL
jgi:hypothetical protein